MHGKVAKICFIPQSLWKVQYKGENWQRKKVEYKEWETYWANGYYAQEATSNTAWYIVDFYMYFWDGRALFIFNLVEQRSPFSFVEKTRRGCHFHGLAPT